MYAQALPRPREVTTLTSPASPFVELDEGHEASRLWRSLLDGAVTHKRRQQVKPNADDAGDIKVEATTSERDTGAMVLPKGVHWLHKASAGRRSRHLFVRESSFAVCNLIDQRRRQKSGGAVVMYVS